MKDLSIIIPYAGEFPQVLFTVRSVAAMLQGKLDFEIIVINNDCPELREQWNKVKAKVARNANGLSYIKEPDVDNWVLPLSVMAGRDPNNLPGLDKSSASLKACSGKLPWLRYMEFKERLSHWECKRLACEVAEADTFLFLDAHTVVSHGISDMFETYKYEMVPDETAYYYESGSMHMPLTYKILEWHRLIYKKVIEKGFYNYSFSRFPGENDVQGLHPVKVPCMSTCGMMISREVYNKVGGWPKDFGAYGGGENFMNYALAVTGHDKWIYPQVTCYHHGDGRDYHQQFDTTLWNRLVAHYLFGGESALHDLAENSRGNKEVIHNMVCDIKAAKKYQDHRKLIENNTKISLEAWVRKWED